MGAKKTHDKEEPFMLKRPDWDTYFMEITHIIAKRSNCLRRHVGAILVKDHRIITTG